MKYEKKKLYYRKYILWQKHFKAFLFDESYDLNVWTAKQQLVFSLQRKKIIYKYFPFQFHTIGHSTRKLSTLVENVLFFRKKISGNMCSWVLFFNLSFHKKEQFLNKLEMRLSIIFIYPLWNFLKVHTQKKCFLGNSF